MINRQDHVAASDIDLGAGQRPEFFRVIRLRIVALFDPITAGRFITDKPRTQRSDPHVIGRLTVVPAANADVQRFQFAHQLVDHVAELFAIMDAINQW